MYYVEDERIAQNLQRKLDSLPVTHQKGQNGKENGSVVDKRLEYQDPTPSIHDLFMLFDKRFFWSQLGMVEVKWSHRMTSCAGICYYQGRRGLCSIRLSAPLLSLRTRKDLVETLLHEMIHAYLFVTANYKDRDDHGPEFHKHMYRINSEAGTNITVYHSFLDEVSYYQKHIWRCNGPCQNQRPYFGFVKRAMNRAPGPYDNWWKDHQFKCGGTFIKISEPLRKSCKNKKKKNELEKDANGKTLGGAKDIRNYFQSGSPQKLSSSYNSNKSLVAPNIFTLQDLKRSDTSSENCAFKFRNNQTFVIAPKPERKVETLQAAQSQQHLKNSDNQVTKKIVNSPQQNKLNFLPETATQGKSDDKDLNVKETVRNAWARKYPSPNKMEISDDLGLNLQVKKKVVPCPMCNKCFSETDINNHIDACLEIDKKIFDEGMLIEETQEEKTNAKVSNLNNSNPHCPICNEALDQQELNDHLESCVKCSFENDNNYDTEEIKCNSVPCPCCLKWVLESTINSHIDECLTLIMLKNSVESN